MSFPSSQQQQQFVLTDPSLLPWGFLHNDAPANVGQWTSVSEAIYSSLVPSPFSRTAIPLTKLKAMIPGTVSEAEMNQKKQQWINSYIQFISDQTTEACVRAYSELSSQLSSEFPRQKSIDSISAAIQSRIEKDDESLISRASERALKELGYNSSAFDPFLQISLLIDNLEFTSVAQYAFYSLFSVFDPSRAYALAGESSRQWMSHFDTLQTNYLAVNVFKSAKKALSLKIQMNDYSAKLLSAVSPSFQVIDSFPSIIQPHINRSTNRILQSLKAVEPRAFIRILDYSETAPAFKQWIIQHRLTNLFRTVQELSNYLGEGQIRSTIVYSIIRTFYSPCFAWDVKDNTLVSQVPSYWRNWVKEACDKDTWERIKPSLPRTLYFAWTYASELLFKVRANQSVIDSYMSNVPLVFSKRDIYAAIRNILSHTQKLCELILRPFTNIDESEYKLVQRLLKLDHSLSALPFQFSDKVKLRKYPVASNVRLALANNKDETMIVSMKDMERKNPHSVFIQVDFELLSSIESSLSWSFQLESLALTRVSKQVYVLVEYIYLNLYSLSHSTRSLLLYYG